MQVEWQTEQNRDQTAPLVGSGIEACDSINISLNYLCSLKTNFHAAQYVIFFWSQNIYIQ